ncbi:MAG TPA: hypothetical protein VN713_01720 [Sphingomicrobium sp.]|nr:hypothetical protein [Sphingomicrobium sp.]
MSKPATANVTIILQPSKNPPFIVNSSLLQGKRLTFKNNKFPGFYIYFKLEDTEKSGYLFPANPTDAFASKELTIAGDECPNQGEQWSQLVPETVSSDYKTLTVRNYNTQVADFGYSLFVTKDPEGDGDCLKLDPIGSNQNGPTNMAFYDYLLSPTGSITAIVAVLVVLFLLYEAGVFAR